MPDLTHWTVFIGATSVLLITPGPSVMYVAARAIAQGWRAAVLSSIGLALGDTLQVIGTAFGLSAALVSAPWLFMGLKLAGAGYLVSLGTYTLMGKNTRSIEIRSERVPSRTSSNKLILQGFLALNPKTTLFFLAFLPQFIALGSGSIRIQILEFGITFAIL
jgi:threonine/homoserine/homoserine lactone efflux protein